MSRLVYHLTPIVPESLQCHYFGGKNYNLDKYILDMYVQVEYIVQQIHNNAIRGSGSFPS